MEEPSLVFIQCPLCGELRKKEDTESHVTCVPQKVFHSHLSLPDLEFDGVTVVQEFISDDQEQALVQAIDRQPWAESQSGRRKQVRGCGPK